MAQTWSLPSRMPVRAAVLNAAAVVGICCPAQTPQPDTSAATHGGFARCLSMLVVGTGAAEEVVQTWSGPRAVVSWLDKTEGSGAGWLRGIRRRAQVTPLALLARSHLTCP